MFGLQEIVAFNNGTPLPRPTIEISTNAAALRAASVARDSSQPDANAVQLARQNDGSFCSKCGSSSGHFDFCPIINGGAYPQPK
jgi:hypothetical protein